MQEHARRAGRAHSAPLALQLASPALATKKGWGQPFPPGKQTNAPAREAARAGTASRAPPREAQLPSRAADMVACVRTRGEGRCSGWSPGGGGNEAVGASLLVHSPPRPPDSPTLFNLGKKASRRARDAPPPPHARPHTQATPRPCPCTPHTPLAPPPPQCMRRRLLGAMAGCVTPAAMMAKGVGGAARTGASHFFFCLSAGEHTEKGEDDLGILAGAAGLGQGAGASRRACSRSALDERARSRSSRRWAVCRHHPRRKGGCWPVTRIPPMPWPLPLFAP